MVLNSLPFAAFFLIFLAFLLLLPKCFRKYWLLLGNLAFAYTWERWGPVLLLLSALMVWGCGLALEKHGRKRICLILPVAWNLLLLAVFRYSGLIRPLLLRAGISGMPGFRDLAAPLGLSFYTLRCIAYAADIRRGTLPAVKDPVDVLAYVSFFPQLISGPIERPGKFFTELAAFSEMPLRDLDRILRGFLLFVWGLFQKIVLAERLAMITNFVFPRFEAFGFWEILGASFAYTLQIYCDFAGYSDMSRGVAVMAGFRTMRNFRQPYFAAGIKSFWRRWHISLTSWLTDHIYIPLGGSRKGQLRKYLNIVLVFLVSGLWHGTTLNFIFWGMLHAAYQIAGDLWDRSGRRLPDPVRRIIMLLEVDFAWIFFNAGGLNRAFRIVRQMFSHFSVPFGNGTPVLSGGNWAVLFCGLAVLFVVDLLHEKGIAVQERAASLPLPVRWLLLLGLFWSVIMLGIYGVGYDTSGFIYARF